MKQILLLITTMFFVVVFSVPSGLFANASSAENSEVVGEQVEIGRDVDTTGDEEVVENKATLTPQQEELYKSYVDAAQSYAVMRIGISNAEASCGKTEAVRLIIRTVKLQFNHNAQGYNFYHSFINWNVYKGREISQKIYPLYEVGPLPPSSLTLSYFDDVSTDVETKKKYWGFIEAYEFFNKVRPGVAEMESLCQNKEGVKEVILAFKKVFNYYVENYNEHFENFDFSPFKERSDLPKKVELFQVE